MFDFLEEELLEDDVKKKEKSQEKKDFELPKESMIFTMPEKFRKKLSGSSFNPFVLVILCVVVVIATIGGVLFLVLSQSKQSRITLISTPLKQISGQESPKGTPLQEPTSIPENLLSSQATSTISLVPQNSEISPIQPTAKPPQSTQTPSVPSNIQQQVLSGAPDLDNDELTDKEEEVWRTDPQKPDTDSDGFLDGPELLNLYDPTKSDRARLADSAISLQYKNQTYRYSFTYPGKMIASPSNNSEREVILSSSTGELFSSLVQDNPQRLSPLEWYKTQVSKNGSADGVSPISYNGWTGVLGPDGRTVFITPADTTQQLQNPILVVVTYNVNTQTQLHFMRTFQILLRSFSFF